MERVYFKVDGEWLTDFIRILYYKEDKSYEECKEKLINSLCLNDMKEEEKTELFESILYGKKRFVGENSFDLVDDENFDVYMYSKFRRPVFENKVIGFLLRDGVFVQCEYEEHSSTLRKIGEEKAKGAIVFSYSLLMGDAYASKDVNKYLITEQQKKWIENNKEYLSKRQIEDIEYMYRFNY